MTRFLALLMIMAGLGLPATAQEAAPATDDKTTAMPAEGDEATAEEEDDDDDGDEAAAAEGVHDATGKFDYGFSGLLARDNRSDLAPLTLASGQPVATQEYTLKSGGYYRIKMTADGSQELALSGGDFFRSVWVNEIVVNDIEIRPMGVHSIEFDNAGTAEMSFVAVTPGKYTLSVPGSSGDTLHAVFNIQ